MTHGLRDLTPQQYGELCEQLAPSLAAVPGLIAETWIADEAEGRYGAFFVFETKAAADSFVASGLFAVFRAHRGLSELSASQFSVSRRRPAIARVAEWAGWKVDER